MRIDLAFSGGGPTGRVRRHRSCRAPFEGIKQVIQSVRQASFPRLSRADIAVYDLRSDSDYLLARFTFSSFFPRNSSNLVFFNQEAIRRQVPAEGLRAVVAHELATSAITKTRARWAY